MRPVIFLLKRGQKELIEDTHTADASFHFNIALAGNGSDLIGVEKMLNSNAKFLELNSFA